MKIKVVPISRVVRRAGLPLAAEPYVDPTHRIDRDIAVTARRLEQSQRRLERLQQRRDEILRQESTEEDHE